MLVALAAIAAAAPSTGHRLRVSLFLDSCFSAEFLLRFLDSAFAEHRKRIIAVRLVDVGDAG